MKNFTLEEIGKLAGVSRSTVSRVINNQDSVSEKVRQRVQKVVTETGYQPNLAARTLASNRSKVIGFVIPSHVQAIFSDPYFPRLIEGVTQTCNRHDYTVSLFLFHTKDEEEKIYPRVLRTGFVDGVIITATQMGDSIIPKLILHNMPFVVVGRPDYTQQDDYKDHISFVDADNKIGAYTATMHLISLGYTRIATITGPLNTTAGIDRRDGYLDALIECGRKIDRNLIIEGDFTELGGYKAMQQLLSHQPDAVFVASDVMALGGLDAIRDHGLDVPNDIALMGFDDLLPHMRINPPLTTIRQPVEEAGVKAMELLLDLLENGISPPRSMIIPTELIIRRSCGADLPK